MTRRIPCEPGVISGPWARCVVALTAPIVALLPPAAAVLCVPPPSPVAAAPGPRDLLSRLQLNAQIECAEAAASAL